MHPSSSLLCPPSVSPCPVLALHHACCPHPIPNPHLPPAAAAADDASAALRRAADAAPAGAVWRSAAAGGCISCCSTHRRASLRTRSHQRSFIPRIPFRWLATRARQPRVAHTSCCPLVRVCRPGQWPVTGLAQNERSKRHWLTLARTRVCATLVLPGVVPVAPVAHVAKLAPGRNRLVLTSAHLAGP